MSAGDSVLVQKIQEAHQIVHRIEHAISNRVVGQEQLRRRLIIALIAEGHVLLEGVPGLAKTLSIKAIAEAVSGSFKRIQFTPDLLPADLIGTEVFRPHEGKFEVRKGPVFSNFILADEINRAPAKVQSALLETMQEKTVTIGETTFRVPDPFFVLATQNPIEQEGTYPLPEAQIDRFMLKIKVNYPSPDEERRMLSLVTEPNFQSQTVSPVASLADLRTLKEASSLIYVDDKVRQYIVNLVNASRSGELSGKKIRQLILLGASPRATISLFLAARAEALLQGAHFVVPQQIKDIAPDVLRHRIIPSYEAEAQGLDSEAIVKMILDGVQVP